VKWASHSKKPQYTPTTQQDLTTEIETRSGITPTP